LNLHNFISASFALKLNQSATNRPNNGELGVAVHIGLCPDWDSWVPENALPNCTEAMDAAEEWLDVPQVWISLKRYIF